MTAPRIIARNGHGHKLTQIDLWSEQAGHLRLDCADGCPVELRPLLESRGYTIEEIKPEPEPPPQLTREAWDLIVHMARCVVDVTSEDWSKTQNERRDSARRFLTSLERDNP